MKRLGFAAVAFWMTASAQELPVVVEPLEPAPAASASSTLIPVLNPVRVNGQAQGDALLLRSGDGRLLARREDWARWKLRPPEVPPERIQGSDWWPLDGAEGFRAEFDPRQQTASLYFAAAAFQRSGRSLAPSRLSEAQRPTGLGGFFNYDLVAQHNRLDGSDSSHSLNGQFETGLFNPWGLASSQWTALDLDRSQGRLLRLESTLRRDDPRDMSTLQLGDSVGRAGLWGRAARFGGVLWGRNFSTQPGFITLPQPALAGEAALPSVLEVYIDGVRRQSLSVPPGPFTVDSIPAVNGMGEIEIVVRDLLGREQVLSLPYVSGARQLRAGLHDYSYETGWLRENFGRASDDYGRFVVTGQHQYGFSDRLTGEARAELRAGGGITLGTGAILASSWGVFSTALAGSQEAREQGLLGLIAWQRSLRRGLSAGSRLLLMSEDFFQTGNASGFAPPISQFNASLGLPLLRRANLGLGYAQQRPRGAGETSALSANLSTRWWGAGSLSLLASQRLEPSRDLLLTLSYSQPIAARTTAGSSLRSRQPEDGGASSALSARVQRNAPEADGWGYRAAVFQDDRNGSATRGEASARVHLPFISTEAEGSVAEQNASLRLSASGGLGFYEGSGFASRRISNGFAVVHTGAADIPLRLNGQFVTRTGADGRAVLPNLQPYQENRVQADAGALPIEVEVPLGDVTAIPHFRSALRVDLPVRRTRAALVQLLDAQGAELPAGLRVQLGEDSFPVARAGTAYVTGLQAGENLLRVERDTWRCLYRALLPPEAGPQPTLGPLPCEALP